MKTWMHKHSKGLLLKGFHPVVFSPCMCTLAEKLIASCGCNRFSPPPVQFIILWVFFQEQNPLLLVQDILHTIKVRKFHCIFTSFKTSYSAFPGIDAENLWNSRNMIRHEAANILDIEAVTETEEYANRNPCFGLQYHLSWDLCRSIEIECEKRTIFRLFVLPM